MGQHQQAWRQTSSCLRARILTQVSGTVWQLQICPLTACVHDAGSSRHDIDCLAVRWPEPCFCIFASQMAGQFMRHMPPTAELLALCMLLQTRGAAEAA